MSLSNEEQDQVDEEEFVNNISEIRYTLQKVEEMSREETGKESLFDKILKWWNMIKTFFKNLSKKVVDLFWKYSRFFVGLRDGFSGFAMANFFVSLNCLIRIGGSARSTILNIYDLTPNSLGNPTWWTRYDLPHPNVAFPHININPRISGVPDPHIPISEFTVAFVEFVGPILKFLQDIAPYLLAVKIALDAGRIGYNVYLDIKNKTTRNTIKAVLNILLSSIGGLGGFHLGCFLGTMILPGIGTLLGALIIGAIGGIGLGLGGDWACDKILDRFGWDIYNVKCENCDRVFKNRRYEDGHQMMCQGCRDRTVAVFNNQ